MAITPLGSLGHSSDYSTTRQISISPTRFVPSGSLVVVWYAQDQVFSVFNPTTGWNFHRVQDSAGNIYTHIAGRTGDNSFFFDGALCSIHVCQLKYALTTDDTITVYSASDPPGSYAKAVSVQEFDLGDRKRWAVPNVALPGNFEFVNADPPGVSFSPGQADDREYLYLYCLGSEGPDTDAYTFPSDWTEVEGDGTDTGTATSDIHVRGAFKVSSAGSESLNVSSDTADRKGVEIMRGVTPVGTRRFPRTGLLDDFNRADESPLDNGTWSTTRTAYGSQRVDLVSNRAGGDGGSIWDEVFSGCAEIWFEIPVFLGRVDAWLHVTGSAHDVTLDGHGGAWTKNGEWSYLAFGKAGFGGDIGTPFFYSWSGDPPDGARIGVQRLAPEFDGDVGVDHLWVDVGAGWQHGGAVVELGGDPNTSGNLALALSSTTSRLDNLHGGSVPCNEANLLPQIIRRPTTR